jgi:DHA2 family lincomycin resistance protein-like MFS transporter
VTTEALTLDSAPPPTAVPGDTARNKLVISLLLVSAFVVILNETIMSVAIPHLMTALNASASAAQWLTTGFLLTMAVVIPITGFLLQRLTTRTVYIAAMTLFSVGTALAAISPNLELLIVARIVQATGTAIMMPLLMTSVMTLVPPETRGKTMGNISIVMSVAPAIGPAIGGLILSALDWRFIFILVLPIALGALALGYRRMVNIGETREAPLDVLSVILSAFAFGGIVYGLSTLGEGGSQAQAVPGWVPLVVGLVAMAVFVVRQLGLQKINSALLDFRTFASKNFTIAIIMMAIVMMAMFGTIILLPIYLQKVLGLEALWSGLILLPGGLLMGLLGPVVGRLYDKVGPTLLLVPGMMIISGVLWLTTLLGPDTWIGYIVAGHLLISVGFALMFTPIFTVSLSSVPPHLYSHGSAMLGSIQQVAGAAGIALFVALMTLQQAALTAQGASEIEALNGGVHAGFVTGAVISLFAIVAAFFVRKPANHGQGGGHSGH